MAWPQPTDYNAAMQNPSFSFSDPDLRQGRPALDPLGLPRLHSGNFADVYRIDGSSQSWAVKCFTRPVPGLDLRYRALSTHLQQSRRPFLVDFTYLEDGIRIRGRWFPVLKMRWVEGFTLNQFIEERADQPAIMTKLANLWQKLGRELREARIGHGDLQHGNVLLVPGGQGSSLALKLIDYDGMWVPELGDRPSGEVGHPNFQHPRRLLEGGYGPEIDAFSLLVVYTALRAVAVSGRDLWRRHDSGENLLFREADFREPERSKLWSELLGHDDPAVQALTGHLLLTLRQPPEATPRLEELLDGETVCPLSRSETAEARTLIEGRRKPQLVGATARPGSKAVIALDDPVTDDTLDGPKGKRTTSASATERAHPEPNRADASARNSSMSNSDASRLPPPSPEQRRVAAGQFERATQVVATGNYDYGLQLFLSCCKLDPANLIYRQALRRTEKAKYRNNLRGHWLSWLTTLFARARLRGALRRGDYLKVLEHGEAVLLRNPWAVSTQMRMAEAAEALGLLDLAAWTLEQARQKQPRDPVLNRALARLYERRGNFTQATALWELVRREVPSDSEAMQKVKDLAASDTIARGHYQDAIERPGAVRDGTASVNETHASATSPTSPVLSVARVDRTARETAPLQARIQSDPTSPHNYLQLAALHRRAGRLDEARAVLTQGLGPTGNAFELMVELAELDLEPFRRDLILTEEKLAASPGDAQLQLLRTRLRKEVNTRELDLHRRKADRFPTDLSHRYEVGVRLFRIGQTDEAIKELQAVRSDPRYGWRALCQLGHCFLARNNWRLAQRNLEEALSAMPESDKEARKEVLFLLARGYADSGEYARAVDLGHELAHLDFSYRDIGRLLDEWQRKAQEG